MRVQTLFSAAASALLVLPVSAVGAGFRFAVDETTLHNARQLEEYSARIDGLVMGNGNASTVTFEKISGDGWITVNPNGTITGAPDSSTSGVSQIEVRASANGGSSTTRLAIPVRKSSESLVEDLNVMTYNLWFGGTEVSNYHEKQVRFILTSGADIVGLEESNSNHAIRLGKALGWYHWQSRKSVGILSRYPIVEEYGEINRSGGVRINLDGDRQGSSEINFWATHLGYTPYGPYDFCFDNMTPEQVLAREAESGRTPQIKETLAGIQPQIDNSDKVPLVLVGDFNAPSHLDWVEGLREKNCGVPSFDWPTSVLPEKSGLIDSFRVTYPDPVAVQGTTWSPVFPRHDGDTGVPEPQDRIDFIYHTEGLEVVRSQVMATGNPKPSPNHGGNEWTSDHNAVMTHYRL